MEIDAVIDTGDFAERIDLFFGAASDAVCRVYARLECSDDRRDLQLAGTLTGPTCAYAETLPATFSFVDRGPGASPLAEAVVPEPCFWTPQMPHLYRADVQLLEGGRVVARFQRAFGIRPLGAAGRKLIYAGKNWVLRGVSADAAMKTDLPQWRDADSAMLVRHPDNALCAAASRVGVLVLAQLDTADGDQIRRLSRSPAVGFIVLPTVAKGDLQGIGHNAILTQRFAVGRPITPASWADAAMCELETPGELPAGFVDCPIPLFVIRPAGVHQSVAAARSACDRLQRDLAIHGQFAGYIV
jgi:hypothetical protein